MPDLNEFIQDRERILFEQWPPVNMPNIDTDDYKYVKNYRWNSADLSDSDIRSLQARSLSYYFSNPLANRIINVYQDYTVPKMEFQAKDRKVQQVLEDFWYDPVNNWSNSFNQRIKELFLFGEKAYLVSKTMGKVLRFDPIFPLNIVTVNYNESKKRRTIRFKIDNTKEVEKDIIDINLVDKEFIGLYTGDVFYYRINGIDSGLRGYPIISPILDFLDVLDRFLFDFIERETLLQTFIYDVEVEGIGQAQLAQYRDEILSRSPEPGGIVVHNERAKWSILSPQRSGSTSFERIVSSLFQTIAGGAGLPTFFLGDSPALGRIAGAEITETALRSFRTKQENIKSFLKEMFVFVIDQAIIDGVLSPDVSKQIDIRIPPPSIRDIQRLSGGFSRMLSSLPPAIEMGVISKDDAQKVVKTFLDQFGIE